MRIRGFLRRLPPHIKFVFRPHLLPRPSPPQPPKPPQTSNPPGTLDADMKKGGIFSKKFLVRLAVSYITLVTGDFLGRHSASREKAEAVMTYNTAVERRHEETIAELERIRAAIDLEGQICGFFKKVYSYFLGGDVPAKAVELKEEKNAPETLL